MSFRDSVCGTDAKALFDNLMEILESNNSKSSEEGPSLLILRDLLTSTAKLVGARAVEHQKKEVIELDQDLAGIQLMDLPDAQFLEPRGRFRTKVSSTGLMLEGKTASTFVSWAHVTHSAVVPAHQSTKKEGEDMLAMRLAPDQVTFNGKPLKNLLWNMQKMVAKPLKVSIDMGEGISETIEGTESHVITSVVTKALGKPLVRPRGDLFETVATKDAKPFLRCHKGTQEGAIYPLECGVVFIKPTLFLPTEEIASINAGRGGGSGQTRFVDLILEMASDEKAYEFTNIDREELPALQKYVKGYLEARAAAAAAVGEDSEDDDEDYDGEDSSEDDSDDDDSSEDDEEDYEDEKDDGENEETEDEEVEELPQQPAKEKKAIENKDVRKRVPPKQRGSSSAPSVKKEGGGVTDLTSSNATALASVDAAAAIKAAYQRSFQGKRKPEGEENAGSAENKKKVKVEGQTLPVKAEVTAAVPPLGSGQEEGPAALVLE